MATSRIWPVRARIDQMVDYVSDENKTIATQEVYDYVSDSMKTEEQKYVSYINCSFDSPHVSMQNTRKQFNDKSNIEVYHAIQSFNEGEVTAQQCHDIGVELANKLWGDRYEVVVATHLNTDHYHNHFIINATSFVDGKRYCNLDKDIKNLRKTNDEICKSHGLKVLNQSNRRTYSFKNRQLRELVKEGLDYAIDTSTSFKICINTLENWGFDCKYIDDELAIKHPTAKTYLKISTLGKRYDEESIRDRCESKYFANRPKQYDLLRSYHREYKQGLTGKLPSLHIWYLECVGVVPENRARQRKYSTETYKAIKYLDKITEQTTLMGQFNIKTLDDLTDVKVNFEEKIEDMKAKRNQLRNKIRRCNDPNQKLQYQELSKECTATIKGLKKWSTVCDELAIRSKAIEEFALQVDSKMKIRKQEIDR